MSKGVFITGTDTGVGKTFVSLAMMAALQKGGEKVCGMKPVASGALRREGVLMNEDALALQAQSSVKLDYQYINPFVYELATAPHIAAHESSSTLLSLEAITSAYRHIEASSDWLVVEGVGGWCVPLTEQIWTTDLVKKLELPVILVVAIKLGCINHAILTARQIYIDGCQLNAWVANVQDPNFEYAAGYIHALQNLLPVPLLVRFPNIATDKIKQAAEKFSVSDLINSFNQS